MQLQDELSDLKTVTEMLDIPTISIDLVTSLCGKKIGFGQFRDVFEYNLDDRFVIKIEARNTNCNIVEDMIWDEVKGLHSQLSWVKDWFAPVEWISPNGRILVMRKTRVRPIRFNPKKVPAFLWDVKPDNFGWYKGKYVCHDYGQFYNMTAYPKLFKKIDWTKF